MLTTDLVPQTADTVAIGPIVWEGDYNAKCWYFSVASSPNGVDRLTFGGDLDLARDVRNVLLTDLMRRNGVVVFETDDELVLAKFCAARWPGGKYDRVVSGIEAEKLAEQSSRH